MTFIPKLKEFLKVHGVIYTVRTYRYKTLKAQIDDIGEVNRVLIMKVDDFSELEDYVDFSGFLKLKDWTDMIGRFNHLKKELYLYRVTTPIITEVH
jgi:hypothetical protein